MIEIIEDEKEFIKELKKRGSIDNNEYAASTKKICLDILENGNKALFTYISKWENTSVTIDNIRVDKSVMEKAYNDLDSELKSTLNLSAKRIREFHEKQKQNTWLDIKDNGEILGQRVRPLESVGIYVPGGKACYPSTVLMNSIPAKVAGVEKIIMTTPARNEGLNKVVLAAAFLGGVDEIYQVGGAQAIAALAYGTTIVPKVDKIVGPGNIYVALAKREVYGNVDIDSIAGPSEILILADETANPKYVAADLLSQAEHDELASGILITSSYELAMKVKEWIRHFYTELNRKSILDKSLSTYSKIIVSSSIDKAIQIVNEIAPEHLEIAMNEYMDILPKIKNAGAIFLGHFTPESVGDYIAGPNHVLPTNGTARFFSPLGVDDFIKKSSVIRFSKEALKAVYKDVARFAKCEGLDAHALASTVRGEDL